MTLTILAAAFLLLVILVAIAGFKGIIRQSRSPEEAHQEKCSICRTPYHTSQLIERQVGDHRLLYFCASCIASLHNELTSKN